MSAKGKYKTRREFIRQSAMTAAIIPFLNSCNQNSSVPDASFDKDAINRLKDKFAGQIILPGDADYEIKRYSRVLNPTMDRHPAIITICKSEQDVLRSIEFARQYALEIAVRSGNHSNMGWGTCEKGIVIDLSHLKKIAVDAEKKIAIVSSGVTAEEILAAAAPYGLAPVLGQCGSVGAGIVLGGGLGWLAGKYGATCDNLLSATITTADGEVQKADSITNPDLFWAIRGGGGNFGIASSFEYKLQPVNEILGGSFIYSIDHARAILRFFNEFMSSAPDELQADCYLTNDRVWVQFVFFGDLETGERLLNSFRKFIKPKQDSVKRRFFSEVYTMDTEDSISLPKFNSDKGTYLDKLSEDVIDLVLGRLEEVPRSATVFFNFSHYMHGEVCRILLDATAFELRKPGGVHLAFWITWQQSVDTTSCLTWHNETFERLQVYSAGRIYSNYMSIPGGSSANAVFGTNLPRLAQLKKKYDPDNIFHLNPNIPPA